MSDKNALREKVRQAVHAGTLPNCRPERTWGGPGDGVECTICGAPVNDDEVELEIEFARDVEASGPGQYRVHLRCFDVWELERQDLECAEGAASSNSSPAIPASVARGSPESR